LTEKLHLLVTVNMAEKQTQDIHLPGGFFLPKRQLMRFSALGLTSVICVAVSMIYSGDMISFDLSFNRNPTLYRKMGLVSHLFSYASWFGCSMWISFVGGLVMFNNLPRHVFGRLQSKLFPRYFQFSLLTMCLSLISLLLWRWENKKLDQGTNLTLMAMEMMRANQSPIWFHAIIIATTCANLFYFEPKTTATMFKRHIIEKKLGTGHEVGSLRPTDPKILEEYAKDGELKQINRKFGMLHGLSTTLNLLALCFGVAHIWWLAGDIC